MMLWMMMLLPVASSTRASCYMHRICNLDENMYRKRRFRLQATNSLKEAPKWKSVETESHLFPTNPSRRIFFTFPFSFFPLTFLLSESVTFPSQGFCLGMDSFSGSFLNALPLPSAKSFRSKAEEGFCFDYPQDFIVSINRNAFERSKNESQTMASVGNFSTFDTISVIAYLPKDKVSLSDLDDVAFNYLLSGNLGTEIRAYTRFQANDYGRIGEGGGEEEKSMDPFWLIEYVTISCRGKVEVEELKGGELDCTSVVDGRSIPKLIRRHLAIVKCFKGDIYVINASTSDERWEAMRPKFLSSIRSFSFKR